MIKIKMDNIWTNIAYCLICGGAVGGVLLAILQARGAENDKITTLEYYKSNNDSLKKETKDLKAVIEKRDSLINTKQDEIKSLQSDMFEKSNFIEKYISGGNSYPYVKIQEIHNLENKPTKYIFELKNDFHLPIYDIQINILDYDEFKSKSFQSRMDAVETEHKFIKASDFAACTLSTTNINLMYPESQKSPLVAGHSREYNLYIKIHTRNKMLHQKLTVYSYGNRAYIGTEVHDPVEKKMIKSDYDSSAPVQVQRELKKRLKAIPTILQYTLLE